MLPDGVEGTAAKLATGAWAGGGGGPRGGWRTGPVPGRQGNRAQPLRGRRHRRGHGPRHRRLRRRGLQSRGRLPFTGTGERHRSGAGGPGGARGRGHSRRRDGRRERNGSRVRPRSGRGSERAGRGRSVDRGDRRRQRDGAGGARRLHPWRQRRRGVDRAERSLPPVVAHCSSGCGAVAMAGVRGIAPVVYEGALPSRAWSTGAERPGIGTALLMRGDGPGRRAPRARGRSPRRSSPGRRPGSRHRPRHADVRRVRALEPAGAATVPREGYASAPRPVPARRPRRSGRRSGRCSPSGPRAERSTSPPAPRRAPAARPGTAGGAAPRRGRSR